jgi:hypothetical protein
VALVSRALAAALMVASVSAAAQQRALPARVSAQTLGTVCAENRPAGMTYVLGALDGIRAASVTASGREPFCLPEGTTNDQLTDAAIRYIRANPQEARTSAAAVVAAALLQVYPCPRQ